MLSVQVDWLRHLLGSHDFIAFKAVTWAGVKDVPQRAGPLEAVLRSKCIVLLAVTMKRRSVRYACLRLSAERLITTHNMHVGWGKVYL